MNFIIAVAYHFCPNLPGAFTQPGAPTLADLCIVFSLHYIIQRPSMKDKKTIYASTLYNSPITSFDNVGVDKPKPAVLQFADH